MIEACACSIAHLAPADVYHEETRKARKEYQCIECGDQISIGQQYVYTTMLFEGSWSRHHTCLFCNKVAADFMPCGYAVGGLVLYFRECYDFDYRHPVEDDDDD
jgi:hypothetical protein